MSNKIETHDVMTLCQRWLEGRMCWHGSDLLSTAMRTVSLSSCVTCAALSAPLSADTQRDKNKGVGQALKGYANIFSFLFSSLISGGWALPVSSLLLHTESKEFYLSSCLKLRRETNNQKQRKTMYPFKWSSIIRESAVHPTWCWNRCAVQLYNIKLELLLLGWAFPITAVPHPDTQLGKLIRHQHQQFKHWQSVW